MQDPAELVARAFYAAEHTDEWEKAPASVKQEYRQLAREAIAALNDQNADIRSILRSSVELPKRPHVS
ncbi:hypothetical protein DES45_102342 [Microvirga subterranea]|uniref:Uncharacterized protein n=2 Tax=Microvirga subterranea TaxID=186651 RepID=A0A370HQX7_9HYPH|nr:hypothetical protein DES45_102342 [Microvirga subterranea]